MARKYNGKTLSQMSKPELIDRLQRGITGTDDRTRKMLMPYKQLVTWRKHELLATAQDMER